MSQDGGWVGANRCRTVGGGKANAKGPEIPTCEFKCSRPAGQNRPRSKHSAPETHLQSTDEHPSRGLVPQCTVRAQVLRTCTDGDPVLWNVWMFRLCGTFSLSIPPQMAATLAGAPPGNIWHHPRAGFFSSCKCVGRRKILKSSGGRSADCSALQGGDISFSSFCGWPLMNLDRIICTK